MEVVEKPLEAVSEQEGASIGAYEILETIGTGGMGVVHKVRHRGSKAILAMKILKRELTDDPINIKRFQQELKTTSLLNHPNVVPIYDSGIAEDGRPYFVMEYLEGSTLEEILADEGFLDVDRFVQLFSQVCDALVQAHEKRIIHRDLKPSNIMVTITDTGYELVKVLDFGIARVFQKAPKDGARLTQLGDVLGSPLYMSPEQCLSQKLDERSDLYSLGVCMYEALAGVPPFASENPVEVIMGHLQQRPATFHSIRPDFNIPTDLENLVFSCLEKEPALRPAKIEDAAAELKRISSSMKSRSVFYSLRQMPRRLRHRMKRQIRSLVDARKQWGRPAVALLAVALGSYAYMQYFAPKPDAKYFEDQATLAMLHADFNKVQSLYDEAIQVAKANHVSQRELAQLYERGADDLVTRPYKQTSVNNAYENWEPVQTWPTDNYNSDKAHNFQPARNLLEKALPLVKDQSADYIRVLDKLVSLCKNINDTKSEEAYLRSRIDLTGSANNVSGPMKELALLLEGKGGCDAEAEELWKKVVHFEVMQHSEPYPQSMEPLADFYNHTGKYAQEMELRKQMISEMRIANANGNNYNYNIRQQLVALASCAGKLGRLDESQTYTTEAKKIKD
jgi:serine/threonine protein kinase